MKHFYYNGYSGSAKISIEDGCLFGKIEHISDLVTYEADTIEQLEHEFKLAVDSYLETCQEVGLIPKRPFKGSVSVKLNPEIHDKASSKAGNMGKSLSEYIAEIVKNDVEFHA
jgi:predicted HicB family RNase H-like nuclease